MTVDSRVHYVVANGNLLKVNGQVVMLDLAQHATAAALLVLSCPTHSSISQKLIRVRRALLVNMVPMCRTITQDATTAKTENRVQKEVPTATSAQVVDI